MKHRISENNFDLIRLFAASQVAVLHVMSYLSHSAYWSAPQPWAGLIALLEMFPGVPVFFFISGFLISRSFERTGSLVDYTRNRVLRIYPALHVCMLVNLLMVWATGYFAIKGVQFPDVLLLYVAKTTFVQFYNPDFMRQFGDGVVNGSLWTVCVELQFYFLTPLLYMAFLRDHKSKSNAVLIALIIVSLICNRLLYAYQAEYGDSNYWKLARVSFFPWFYMFLTGVLAQRNFEYISGLLRDKLFFVIVPAYIAYAFLLRYCGFSFHNDISPLLFFPLVAAILVSAYAAPTLARRVLHGNDFSYGIYIYHVPFMNMLLYYGYRDSMIHTVVVVAMTLAAAVVSWFVIEQPSLSRKRRTTHAVAPAQ
jgi:peptidoglycan/LPS O-acetylase OafA/YrhL